MKRLKHCLLAMAATLFLAMPAHAINDVYVIHFVLDGLRYDVLEKELNAEKLPHLQKLFYEKGAVFEKAITTFPTVSSPGYISFATGLSAGNSGIFFLEWFDRTKQKPVGYLTPKGFKRVNSDLINRIALRHVDEEKLYSPLTLFERLAPAPTASVYTPFRKGATITIPKKIPVKALWNGLVAKDGLALNPLAMEAVQDLFSKPLNQVPRYTLVALYGPDYYGHKTGPDSIEIGWDLKQFDMLFKNFAARLQKRGIQDKTYIILSSDHGMHPTGKLLKLRDVLFDAGVDRRKDDVYVSNRGVSSTFLYAAGPKGWEELPTIFRLRNYPVKNKRKKSVDLIKTFYEHPSVGWIAARDTLDRIRIYGKEGEAVITQVAIGNETYFSYTYRLQDPLGYAANPNLKPMLNDKPYSAEAWFQATVDEKHPNAVVELSQLFKDPRAGDILVVAKEPWSFRTAKAGTHGSLNRGDMHIPLWMMGPTVPHGKFGSARSVDIYPLVLKWFGLNAGSIPKHEGIDLFEARNQMETDNHIDILARLEREIMKRPRLNKLIDKNQVIQRLKKSYPESAEAKLLEKCDQEIEKRYQRWKKLDHFTEEIDKPKNKLGIDKKDRGNMKWLLVQEKNLEFERLQRMEDVKTILESPSR